MQLGRFSLFFRTSITRGTLLGSPNSLLFSRPEVLSSPFYTPRTFYSSEAQSARLQEEGADEEGDDADDDTLPGERGVDESIPYPSYLTFALPAKEGEILPSERNKMQPSQRVYNKPFQATVLWKKHPKTLMCVLKTRVMHHKYKKFYDRIKKFQVHDPYDECVAGDIVLVKQSRPYSKCKHHIVDSIYKREASTGFIDENPEQLVTNELTRLIEERKKAVRHSVVYMSEVQQLFLERELLRLEDSIDKARANAAVAAQERVDRLNAIRQAKERDRQAELAKRSKKPRRSLQKLGRPERWAWDPYNLSRRLPKHFR